MDQVYKIIFNEISEKKNYKEKRQRFSEETDDIEKETKFGLILWRVSKITHQ